MNEVSQTALQQCQVTFREIVPVVEHFEGKTIWDGDVHVFGPQGTSHCFRLLGVGVSSGRVRETEVLCHVVWPADRLPLRRGQGVHSA